MMNEPRCYDCGGTPDTCECLNGFVECSCVQVDVDRDDARNCMAHGPRSTLAKAIHRREAEEIWRYYNGDGECPF